EASDCELYVDPAQFEQVLRNIFLNALQAMGSEGLIRISAARSPGHIDITIADTGPGVPEQVREKLFEPLVTTKSRGTGLGLAICRQIVERHQGTIDLLPQSPGATFRIRLPSTEDQAK
ncbi:MAG: sensor histidine kinase, partial [Planctomycetota bacterium]